MDRFSRNAFEIHKFSSFGFIVVYVLSLIVVGHGGGDAVSFFGTIAFCIGLFLFLRYYQRIIRSGSRLSRRKRLLYVIVMAPAVLLSIVAGLSVFSLELWTTTMALIMVLLLLVFGLSGLIVIRYILFKYIPSNIMNNGAA